MVLDERLYVQNTKRQTFICMENNSILLAFSMQIDVGMKPLVLQKQLLNISLKRFHIFFS